MLKKIFGHSILYTIANHLPLVANIIILPIITPYLTKIDYGIYGLTYAYLGGLSAFSLLGIHVLLQNSYFKINRDYKELKFFLTAKLNRLAVGDYFWRLVSCLPFLCTTVL